MTIDGILNVLKPSGLTSFDVVALIRRFSKENKVGHSGTLDPGATGVLVICLGKATKLIDLMSQSQKKYRASIELGLTTDTYDSYGKILQKSDCTQIKKEQLEGVLKGYIGSFDQIPPMYSAIKYKGTPLYRLARKGIDIPRAARQVKILSIEMVEWSPPVYTIDIYCEKGTYIRSLAHDVGQSLGCGAILKNLIRLQNGIFDIGDSVTIDQIKAAFADGTWEELIYPMDKILLDKPATIVSSQTELAIKNGTAINLGNINDGNEWCRAYSLDGRLLALLQFDLEKHHWQPKKVFI
ncbi:MAG: tRNA pseudouridine(55) synthase TruB [Chloroflexi bacterium]|nr:tRNA pseudouridine(55) synthase TruB [Chloroflexota bacterium]